MYTTIEKIKQLVTTSLSDEVLNSYIKTVSEYLNSYVGYTLASDETVEDYLFDGTGIEYAFLLDCIHGFDSVERVMGVSSTPVEVVKYPLNKGYINHFGIRSGVFAPGMANYVVKNAKIGAYSVENLPAEITDIATKLCVILVNNTGISTSETNVNMVKSSETIGSYSVSYANQSQAQVQTLLNPVVTVNGVLEKYKSIKIK